MSGRRRVGGGQAAHLQAPRVKLAACFEEPGVSRWMRLDAVWFPSDVEKQPQRAQQQSVFSGVSLVNSSCELFSRCSVSCFFVIYLFFFISPPCYKIVDCESLECQTFTLSCLSDGGEGKELPLVPRSFSARPLPLPVRTPHWLHN